MSSAQKPSLNYPSARRADVIDNYFGTKVADPYRWMEDLNSPELKQWIDAENALAFGYLDALPQRDALKARITELWNYPKVIPPRYEGGRWFYTRNTGLQRQSLVFIMGGSNGGLLVGAVMEQRHDLFAVVLLGVAVLDMLRFHRFTGGVVGTAEYGSADNATEFAYLYKYSPLHNVTPGACYPATLITTADHDDRVVPSHSFKFAATLQAAQGCDKPVLIRLETQASHAYRPTDKRIAELADGWAFALAKMRGCVVGKTLRRLTRVNAC